MILIVPVFELSTTFVIVVVICELSGRLTYRFDDIDYIMTHFKWYLFPIEIQKILPTILINAQERVVIECFGSIPCDRETLKKVIINMNKLNLFFFIEKSEYTFLFSICRSSIPGSRIIWCFVNL